MKYLLILILLLPIICFGQTNSIVTELYLANNFTPKSGITPGSNNTLAMDCDQITTRYHVSISGVSTTGNRLPSQNQLTSSDPCSFTQIALGYYISSYCGSYTFTSSYSLAQQACIDYYNPSCINPLLSLNVYRVSSVSVGNQLYNPSSPCNAVSITGYYLQITDTSSTIVYVLNGVIQSVTNCP